MTYQVLARKWRPKTFADLVGQEHVVKALKNALDKGRLHHAYLLTGTRGVGKTTIARILAKSLNCETPNHGEPCGVCTSCTAIDQNRFVDLLEIDAASNTGIDNIREVLENAQYAPTAGRYKVYIIDEVHMLSKSAFNAMLKTLEEPPEHVKFILATTDPHKVPITVLSRCLQFVLRNMTAQQVSDHLAHVLQTENIEFEPNALALLGRSAAGSMRDALSLLDQAIAMGSGKVQENDVRHMIGAVDQRHLYELLALLAQKNGEGLLAKAQEMANHAVGFASTLNDLALLLQQLALIQTVPTAIADDHPERVRLQNLAQQFSGEQIQLYYQCIIHGKNDLPLAPDEYAGFVMTLLRMLAFAPFSANATPAHQTISGTSAEQDTSTKKTQLPESHDISPKENALVQADSNVHRDQASTQDEHDSPPWIVDDTPRPNHITPASTQIEPALERVSNKSESESEPESNATVELPPNSMSETWQNENHDETHHAPSESPLLNTLLAQQNQDIPALKSSNWPHIAAYISTQVSAAQMLLAHLAWIHFDENTGTLELALMQDKTRITVSKTYLDRIAATLSHHYQRPIHIQTQPWQENRNWETPLMYQERLRQEAKQKAQNIMEQDQVIQDLQTLFNAKWIENSITLLSTP